jgi:outer membrane protein assembly factor BamD (BamD/ComL family)
MKKYILLVILCVAFVGCKPTKENKLKDINALEAQTMKDAKEISRPRADSLLTMYDNFIAEFPKDSNTVIILYKASDVCANIKDCDKAIAYLDKLISNYPKSYMVEIAKFKKGTIYDQVCHNKEKAQKAYGEFVKEYPKSQYANDAAILFQMLDMPDEMQMIRQFEAKNAETPTTEN